MLRRLLFFLFVLSTAIGGYSQTYQYEVDQSFRSGGGAADSLVISFFIRTAPAVADTTIGAAAVSK